jgi:PAT family beta-lactamase induction signal transducer AmpG
MKKENRSPWSWIPTLYYAQGLPYTIVMTVSVILYKRMGISNTDIALYTSWLYLPWVIKPLWSPIVDSLKTRRLWIVAGQFIIGVSLAGVALTIPLPNFFQLTLAFFWLLAFSSATHDIAVDGFYMLALPKHEQAWFVGIRSGFYRLAMITGQGLIIILASLLESSTGVPNVDVKVFATNDAVVNQSAPQENLTQGEMRIIIDPPILYIQNKPVLKADVDAKLADIKNWNINQGQESETLKAAAAKAKDDSSWTRFVVLPLEQFLREHFGETQKKTAQNTVGNTGIVQFRLSEKPKSGEKVVVNFSQELGDKSIFLVEGKRFVFTEANWNKPVRSLIQLDAKLTENTEAVFQARSGNIPLAWSVTFFSMCGFFILAFVYHKFILPVPESDKPGFVNSVQALLSVYLETFKSFFSKERIIAIIAFLIFFRFAEAQLVKIATLFLLDTKEMGGVGLTTGQVGFAYGGVGVALLMLGGLLGGFVVSKHGLKYWIFWMALSMNIPDITYVYLAYFVPDNFLTVVACVGIEQFGYGFGFVAYMLYMIHASEGEHKTAYFAISTGFMALGMMIPGMFSGWLQEIIGYKHFFVWVMIATTVSFITIKFIPISADFGKKQADGERL